MQKSRTVSYRVLFGFAAFEIMAASGALRLKKFLIGTSNEKRK